MNFDNPSTPPESKNKDSDSFQSDIDSPSGQESKKSTKYNTGRWTQEEHLKFIDGILEYGNEWKKVQSLIKTRSSTQARSHAQKFFLRIKKNLNINDNPYSSNESYLNSPQSNQDNFSIKYFFELLASQDKDKTKYDNGKLTSSQREKLLNIVAKFSNSEFDNIKSKPSENSSSNSIEINEEVNSLTSQMIKLPGRIFNIHKDKSRRESINSISAITTAKPMMHKMSYDISSINTKKKQSPSHTNLDLASTQSLSSINQDNDNKIYQEMKELFGKKRKSETRIDDLSYNDHSRPRFYSTCIDINFDSQKLFDNPDFFPSKKNDKEKVSPNADKTSCSNPFSINFDIDNDISPFNQPYFFDDHDANNNHSDFNFNTLDYDKFNIA